MRTPLKLTRFGNNKGLRTRKRGPVVLVMGLWKNWRMERRHGNHKERKERQVPAPGSSGRAASSNRGREGTGGCRPRRIPPPILPWRTNIRAYIPLYPYLFAWSCPQFKPPPFYRTIPYPHHPVSRGIFCRFSRSRERERGVTTTTVGWAGRETFVKSNAT